MAVKLIAVDLDGTLLDTDHIHIPRRNVTALREARRRGVKVAVATGRAWTLVEDTVAPLGGIDYAILSNGACVLEPATGRWLYRNCISNADSCRLISFLREKKVPFEIYCEGRNYVEKGILYGLPTRAWKQEETMKFYLKVTQFVDRFEEALAGRGMEKIDIFHLEPQEIEPMRRAMHALAPLESATALADNLEFTAEGVHKGAALEALAQILGLTPDEVMVFGDASNDVAMLKWAGWSFCMADSMPEARAAAKYQAPSNHDAGVGQMVEKYVLLS